MKSKIVNEVYGQEFWDQIEGSTRGASRKTLQEEFPQLKEPIKNLWPGTLGDLTKKTIDMLANLEESLTEVIVDRLQSMYAKNDAISSGEKGTTEDPSNKGG